LSNFQENEMVKYALQKPFRMLLLVFGFASAAASQAAEVRPMVKVGFDFGGETLATVVYTDGTTRSIKSNEGVFIGGGASIFNEAKTIETEIALTYKIARISATNGDLEWTRVPLDVLVFYRMHRFRAGGGLTYHMNPEVTGSGLARNVNLQFDNAFGLILQADWLIMDRKTLTMALGLRYTNIEYKLQGTSASPNTSGMGLTYSVSF